MILKVLTYNIHKGFNMTGSEFTLHEIKKSINEINADIVLLQEVVGSHAKHSKKISNWPKHPTQCEFLAEDNWPYFQYGKNASYPGRDHGKAILSKFPIVETENINISTNRWEQRGLLHCTIQLPLEKSVHIFNVHLNLLEGGRKTQFGKIKERISSHVNDKSPILIGGDMNDWTQNLHQDFITLTDFSESHVHLNKKFAQSFPSFYPKLTLDRLYFRHLSILSSTTLQDAHWKKLSDHLPMLVEFEI